MLRRSSGRYDTAFPRTDFCMRHSVSKSQLVGFFLILECVCCSYFKSAFEDILRVVNSRDNAYEVSLNEAIM